MTRIFLTGGSGFIGRHIKEQLGDEFVIFAPTHQELELTDKEAVQSYLKKNPVDVVVHAANSGGTRKKVDQPGLMAFNLRVFYNILSAKEYFGRLINLGSGAEYDKSGPITMVKETDFGHSVPRDEYGLYKYIAALEAEKTNIITHLRLFGIFGKYEDPDIRFISNAICRALYGEPITIKQNVSFDYLYINDCVKILRYFIAQPGKQIFYNVCRGVPIDLKTIAEKISAAAPRAAPITLLNEGWGKQYTGDNNRLLAEMPEFAFTSFETALTELMAYYTDILPSLDRDAILKTY